MLFACKDCQKSFKFSQMTICVESVSKLSEQIKQRLVCEMCLGKHRLGAHSHFKLDHPENKSVNSEADQSTSSNRLRTRWNPTSNGNPSGTGFGRSNIPNSCKNKDLFNNGYAGSDERVLPRESPPPIYSAIARPSPQISNDFFRRNVEENGNFGLRRRDRSVARNGNAGRNTFKEPADVIDLGDESDSLDESPQINRRIEYDYKQIAYGDEAKKNAKLTHLKVTVPRTAIADNVYEFTIRNTTNRTMLIQIVHWQPHDSQEDNLSFEFPDKEKEEDDPQYKNSFEIESGKTGKVRIDFSAVEGVIREWSEKNDSSLFPYVFFRGLGRLYDDGRHDCMEWTIRFESDESGDWCPKFDRKKPKKHRFYKP
ncbi:unnamed protein product, partial [Mesorhabditis belari]|uniref:Uncharacterized protein n=1 Tax=Mesorhabditis belari TaxID=2138241 RepID=A0AAF3F319_9BILA